MDFSFTEEQLIVKDMARSFMQKELMPIASKLDKEEVYPVKQLKSLAELGLMGMNIPEQYGGSEMGTVAYSLALSEIAYGCASTAVAMSVTNMVAEIIYAFGNEQQRALHIPKITSGEYVTGAFGLSEPSSGSDASSIKTKAVKNNGSWILNGEKMWITNGEIAGVFIVWARTGGPGSKGLSAFLVTQQTPGFSIGKREDKMGLRGSSTVPLIFEDCIIPESSILGKEGEGFKIAMMALDGGRIGIASQSIGIAQAALDEAKKYAQERVAFGKPIADFQAIQWMLADSATELDAAKLMTIRSAWLKENKKPYTLAASMAKLLATESANKICERCFQIHGGYGYVKEYPIERHLRDIRVTTIYEGTSEIQRLVIGRHITDNK